MRRRIIATWGLALCTGMAFAAPSFDLSQLEQLALSANPALAAARDQVSAARWAVSSAAAFPNPEVEYLSGRTRPRLPGGSAGATDSITLSQPLDLPMRRSARIGVAEAGLAAAMAATRAAEAEWLARLRLRYFEVLRREAEEKNAREDLALMEGVRSRIATRVQTGEAPRFELIKAEAETLNAQKNTQAAGFRVAHARSQLRQAVGPALPADFTLSGELGQVPALPEREALRQELAQANPDLARARAEVERAAKQLELERAHRLPSLAIKATRDTDPDVRSTRVGLALSVPLWDRRDGPVGEAAAQLSRARNELDERQFSLAQALDMAYQQYEIAHTQVSALEAGIVSQAEAALKVAEAGYRFGERGFIEVLDAQRVYRAARAELIAARFELAAAWVEIEKLRAIPGETKQ